MHFILNISLITSVVIVILGYSWQFYNKIEVEFFQRENIFMFIGITSRPDHFSQRKSLRETWLTHLPQSSKYMFLVGRNLCNIHPQDRVSQFSCENIHFSIPINVTEDTMIDAHSKISNLQDDDIEAAIGFSFHVQHPITIHQFGVKRIQTPVTNKGIIRVVFKMMDSLEYISSATFDYNSLTGSPEGGYTFKRLKDPIYLPKGFEGIIEVEGFRGLSMERSCTFYSGWNHGNVLSVLDVISNSTNNTIHSSCLLPTFRFTINDLKSLKNGASEERKMKRKKENEEVIKQLNDEAIAYKDILFLDMTDVYRNLSKKVLLFIQWVHQNYDAKYILKTDDDVFIDIVSVVNELEKADDSGWDWWSCLRVGWPVFRHGKWRETVYERNVYPVFPSGAGYILTRRNIEWLSRRAESLSTGHQGEDVAMGIWLEPISPRPYVSRSCEWACEALWMTGVKSHCNVMQLTVEQVYHLWNQFKVEEREPELIETTDSH